MPNTPIIKSAIADFLVTANRPQTTFDLLNYFDDPYTTGQVATFQLYDSALGNGGTTQVVLFDQPGLGAPLSVANFLNYVNGDSYTNSFIHRSEPGFVIQGGGFTANGFPVISVGAIPTNPPIPLEYSAARPNRRGTIAFARTNDPNSATSQWFFNLVDNTVDLGPRLLPSPSDGYAVFGEVLGSADLQTVDAIAALPQINANGSNPNGPFRTLPINAPTNQGFTFTSDDDLLRYQRITVAQQPELSFSVVGNSNPSLVVASLSDTGQLRLQYQPGQTGSATLTLRATNLQGISIEDSFSVQVNSANLATTPATLAWNTLTSVVSRLEIDISSLSAITIPLGRTIKDTYWRFQTTGDLNGDGQDDVLLRNFIAGQNLVWYLQPSGAAIASESLIGRDIPDPNWSLVGTGDFDGDGQIDILLRNEAADQTVAWYMNPNGSIRAESLVGRGFGDNNWKIEATADFNNDGQTDILLRNTPADQTILWTMNGSSIVAEALWGRPVGDPNWQIEGARDFTGNGEMDVLWRYSGGTQAILWVMQNQTQIAQELPLANLPPAASSQITV